MENFVIEHTPTEEKLLLVAQPVLQQDGIEIVDIRLVLQNKSSILSLYLDEECVEKNITIAKLKEASLTVGDVLVVKKEEFPFMEKKYTLEVSSPGLERPLTKVSHFETQINKLVRIKLKRSDEDGNKNLRGFISKVLPEKVTIRLENSTDERDVSFVDIATAQVVYVFPSKKKGLK